MADATGGFLPVEVIDDEDEAFRRTVHDRRHFGAAGVKRSG